MNAVATPPLVAALSVAGTGALTEGSVWLGGAMLLAYGLGHSVFCSWQASPPCTGAASDIPAGRREAMAPGRRVFAGVMALAGGWLALSNAGLS